MVTTPEHTATAQGPDAWRGFRGHGWRDAVDVRGFIVDNYAPYEGGSDFLVGPTVRT